MSKVVEKNIQLDHPLWEFAVGFYKNNEHQLLEFQRREGVNVVELLWGVWLAQQQRQIMASPSSDWNQQVVQPLRQIRTWIKQQLGVNQGLEGFRTEIKAMELQAEKIEFATLLGLTESISEDCELDVRQLMELNIMHLTQLSKPKVDELINSLVF